MKVDRWSLLGAWMAPLLAWVIGLCPVYAADDSDPENGGQFYQDRITEAKKLLAANKYEDLLSLFEPEEASHYPFEHKKTLAEVYFQAASRLAEKTKDASFSSLYCERGLLLVPNHPGLLRRQIRNYLSPEIQLLGAAEELAENLISLEAQNPENALLRGQVALEQGDYEFSWTWLTKAATLGSSAQSAIHNEANRLALLAKKKLDQTKATLASSKELDALLAKARADMDSLESNPSESEEAEGEKALLFRTAWCKTCDKTQQLLKALNVDFEEKDIEHDSAALRQLMMKARNMGQDITGVPVLSVFGRLVIGYNPQRIERMLKKNP